MVFTQPIGKMPENQHDLGKLMSVHGISPAYLQRAIFISMLSFVFFLAMMMIFYVRQNIGYFLLATAFLLIYLVTMFSWVLMRKNQLRVFENGLTYKKNRIAWDEISEVGANGEIVTRRHGRIAIPRSINDFGMVLNIIRSKARLL